MVRSWIIQPSAVFLINIVSKMNLAITVDKNDLLYYL